MFALPGRFWPLSRSPVDRTRAGVLQRNDALERKGVYAYWTKNQRVSGRGELSGSYSFGIIAAL
jgi:hypothetical protein